jgi:hypothetical protein
VHTGLRQPLGEAGVGPGGPRERSADGYRREDAPRRARPLPRRARWQRARRGRDRPSGHLR